MSAALDRLGPGAARFAPVLITLDPERDTPERLKPYVQSFNSRLVGLTGTPAEIAQVLRAYRVQDPRQHEPAAPPRNTVDERSLIYVIGPDGRFRAVVNYAAGVDGVAERLASM
jgi:protein SCO1/2